MRYVFLKMEALLGVASMYRLLEKVPPRLNIRMNEDALATVYTPGNC